MSSDEELRPAAAPDPQQEQLQGAQSVAQGKQEPEPEFKPDWSGFSERAPVLSRKLTEDPKFATGVKDSAPWLAALEEKLKPRPESDGVWEFRLKSALQNERDALAEVWPDIKGSFAAEKDASELLELRARQVLGEANSSEDARAEELSQTRTHWMPPSALEQSFTKGVPGKVAGMAGGLVGDWKGVADATGAGALFGVVGGPGGVVAGAGIGLTAGFARQQAKRSMGEFYDAMLKAKMPDGTPVDPKAARGAALVLGLFNGALGAVPVAGILSKGGLVQKFIGQGGEEYVQRLLASPGASGVLARVATKFAGAEGIQAVIGAVQELATIGAEQGARLGTDPSQRLPPVDWQRLPDAMRSAMQVGVPFSGIEAAAHSSGRAVAHYDNVGKVVENTPLFQQDARQTKDFLQRLADDAQQASVTYPRDKLEAALSDMGLHGDRLKTVMPDVADQLEATAGDPKAAILVSPADNGAYIATSPAWKTLRVDMREGKNFTLNELKELAKTTKEDLAKVTQLPAMPKELAPIYEDVHGQLAKTQALGPVAEKAATLYTSALNAISQATGTDPAELHKKWGLQFVERLEPELDERAAGVPGATVENTGKYRILVADKAIPAKEFGEQKYLSTLREAVGRDKPASFGKGTYGELFDLLAVTTGSPAEAARVLAAQGYDGLDTGKTKRIWAPDILIPRKDPLVITRGSTTFEPGKTTVAFSQHANVATVAHELGHVFLRMWNDALGATPAGETLQLQASFQEKSTKQVVNTGPFHDLSQLPGGTNAHASGNWVDGFTDQSGKFYTRDEAAKAMNTRGQELASGGLSTEDLARLKKSPAFKNFEALKKFLGAEAGFKTEHEEKFARAFVDYLRSGKAPSLALRPVFGSFKGWLTHLYGTQTALGEALSPEVQQVFDKLLASQRAMADAKKSLYVPIFDENNSSGLPNDKFTKLARAMDDAIATARDANERELFSHMSAEGIDAFEKTKAGVRDELIATDSTHSLVSFLKDGVRLDGGPIPMEAIDLLQGDGAIITHKLDTEALKALGVGPETLMQLDELHGPGGLDPAIAAQAFGLDDSQSLVETLKSYKPLDKAVELEAAARMPGWVDTQKWLELRAVDKLAGTVIPKALWAEYEALGGRVGPGGADAIRAATEQMVRNQLRGQKVSGLVPELYLREYHRLGEEARKTAARSALREAKSKLPDRSGEPEKLGANAGAGQAEPPPKPGEPIVPSKLAERDAARIEQWMQEHGGQPPADLPPEGANFGKGKAGDSETPLADEFFKKQAQKQLDETISRLPMPPPEAPGAPSAAELKRRQAVAFEGWKLARQALEDQAKFNALGLKLRDDFQWRSQLPRDEQNAVMGALEAYGFIKPEQTQMNPIDKYVSDQLKKGADIVFDPELKGRAVARNQLGAMTVDQMGNANRFLQSLKHHVEQVDTFDAGMTPKPLEPLVESLAKYITNRWPQLDQHERSKLVKGVAKGGRSLVAALMNMEFIFKTLDGDIHGTLNRTIFQHLVEGEAREFKLKHEAELAMKEYVNGIADKGHLVGDSELRVRDNAYLNPITGEEIHTPGRRLKKTELLSALLNWGSARNREALLKGYGISETELLSAFQKDLKATDYEFANRYWKLHEAILPEVQDTYFQRNGVELEGVKPIAFELTDSDGKTVGLTGGYTQLRYSGDAAHVHALYDVQGFESPDIHMRDDFTRERKGSYGPVELSLPIVLGGVSAKIHYATLYHPVQEVRKVITHPTFRRAITDTIGPEFNDALFASLRNIARDGMPLQPLHAWDRLYRFLMKSEATRVMGMNIPLAYLQADQLIPATMKLGPKNMMSAAKDFLTDWTGTWQEALQQSSELSKMGTDPKLWKIATPMDFTVSVPLADKLKGLGDGTIIRNARDAAGFLREIGMAHHVHVRQMTAMWMFEAAKLQALKEQRPDPIAYADAIIRQYNGGTGMKDLSRLTAQPGLARATVMFYSQMALIANQILSSGMQLKARGISRETLAGMTVALVGFATMPTLLRMYAKREDVEMEGMEPSEAISYVTRAQIGLTCARTIPVGGDILGELIAPDRPGHAVPGGPVGSIAGAVRSAALGTFSDSRDLDPRAIAKVAGFATNLPLDQMYRNIDFAIRSTQGEYGKDFADLFRVYMRGPKKEGYR